MALTRFIEVIMGFDRNSIIQRIFDEEGVLHKAAPQVSKFRANSAGQKASSIITSSIYCNCSWGHISCGAHELGPTGTIFFGGCIISKLLAHKTGLFAQVIVFKAVLCLAG